MKIYKVELKPNTDGPGYKRCDYPLNQVHFVNDMMLYVTELDVDEPQITPEELDALLGRQELKRFDHIVPINKYLQKFRDAEAYLTATDWYVTRSIEDNKPVPDDVSAKRKACKVVLDKTILTK